MLLLELMNEKHMTRAELSRRSGVPESTLRDILNGKAQIDHCEAGTLLTIADVLETTVDEIVVTYWEEALLHHDREVPLEELHDDSSMLTFYMIVDATKLALTAYSDLEFVCEICEEHWIERFHAEGAYRIAFFLLGFIDWVHRKHHLILDPHFASYRCETLDHPVYALATLEHDDTDDFCCAKIVAEENDIPELACFNIFMTEEDIRPDLD